MGSDKNAIVTSSWEEKVSSQNNLLIPSPVQLFNSAIFFVLSLTLPRRIAVSKSTLCLQ